MKIKYIITLTITLSIFNISNNSGKKLYTNQIIIKKYNENDRIYKYEFQQGKYLSLETKFLRSNNYIEVFKYLMYDSNEIEKKIKTYDVSIDYYHSDSIVLFAREDVKKQILILKMEGEIFSYFDILIYEDDTLKYIGDIVLGLNCEKCDHMDYPLSFISVSEENGIVEIKFNKNITYSGSEIINTPYHSVSILADSLKFIYKNKKVFIRY